MLKIDTDILNLEKLDKYIAYVEKLSKMKTNTDFQKYIQDKVWETLQQVMNQRLIGGTTNDESIELYRSSNHIEEISEGFVLYNDAAIPANAVDNSNYPNGNFSLALAFEYGVGITGEGTYDGKYFTAWDYNVNNYNFGWYYTDSSGNSQHTFGYMGFEIYRYVAEEVTKNLPQWVREYHEKEV